VSNAELEAALLAEAPKQWERFQNEVIREIAETYNKVTNAKTKEVKLRRAHNLELNVQFAALGVGVGHLSHVWSDIKWRR
jgi:predicted secreted protein